MDAPRFDNTYARLPNNFYAAAPPTPVPEPALWALNEPLANELGIDLDWLRSEDGLGMLSGNRAPKGAEPIAMAYAGHQFGGWVPQLGDGRATLLGEVVGTNGERYDLHLKGSGRTRFSRGGDGKAVLGPVIREYIVSEAMAALGVPTTRALAAATTGERILRQDGPEPGAVLTRVARSHVRVGTFQYFAGRSDTAAIKTLADYVIDRHYPAAREEPNPYRAMFTTIVERQADLIVRWMSFGFIHGVMNTDNMQIVGETIDYGPCAFMDTFHPRKVFSSIDHYGRYAWRNQPTMALWNLMRLAETLLPLLDDDEKAAIAWVEANVDRFEAMFQERLKTTFGRKLGIVGDVEPERHGPLIDATFEAMTAGKVDFTLFYRHLTALAAGGEEGPLRALFDDHRIADTWLVRWREQLGDNKDDGNRRVAMMRAHNPIIIARNHQVEAVIQAANGGDDAPFGRLVSALQRPFEEQPENADLERAPEPDEVVKQTFCGT